MTFVREHHRMIAAVLGILDAPLLRERRCYFAGGTALALRFGEYRESIGIDFIVADDESYKILRAACRERTASPRSHCQDSASSKLLRCASTSTESAPGSPSRESR